MYSHIHYGWVNTSKWRKTDYKKIMSIWNVLLLPTSLPDQSCAVCCFLCALSVQSSLTPWSKNAHTKVHGEDKLAETLNYKAKCWNHFLGRKTTNQQLIVDLRVWGGLDCLSSKDVNTRAWHPQQQLTAPSQCAGKVANWQPLNRCQWLMHWQDGWMERCASFIKSCKVFFFVSHGASHLWKQKAS